MFPSSPTIFKTGTELMQIFLYCNHIALASNNTVIRFSSLTDTCKDHLLAEF